MRLLLDTHAVLWFAAGDPRPPAGIRDRLTEPANEIRVSHATVWELAIKISLGKLRLDRELSVWLDRYVEGNGFALLPIAGEHAT